MNIEEILLLFWIYGYNAGCHRTLEYLEEEGLMEFEPEDDEPSTDA